MGINYAWDIAIRNTFFRANVLILFQNILNLQSANNTQIYNKMKEKVLQAMREAGKPVSSGEVSKALGAERKEIDKAFAELKKEGAIVSPVRCKWEPSQK